jgi:hypothetical protein
MLAFPWGLNHVTNRYLKGTNFQLEPRCENHTRANKAGSVALNPLALKAVSFCKRREVRPDNCGTCTKCVRTKVMFAATLGYQPDIFLDPTFDEDTVNSINLDDKNEQAFFVDLCQIARSRGTIGLVPGLADRFAILKERKA